MENHTFDINALDLIRFNAAVRDVPDMRVMEEADWGRLHQIASVARRYGQHGSCASAATFAVCIPRYRCFPECNILTAALAVRTTFDLNAKELTTGTSRLIEIVRQAASGEIHISDLAFFLERESISL